jgi:hypothetical protein
VPRQSGLALRLLWVSVFVALLPIVVATVRAVAHDWVPAGDNAVIEARALELLNGHPPLLGTWSSASTAAGTDISHPGPLLEDVLAVPVRLGGESGIAIGAGLINAAAVAGIALVGWRRGGALVAAAAVAMAAVLSWSMGSELLYEPWNPHVVLLPFFLVLMLVWSVTRGDLLALPWAVGVASLVVQSHLSYVSLVALLGVWVVVGLALELRARRARDPHHWPALRRRTLQISMISAGVFAACWLQPLIEQFTSDGKGNLSRLAGSARGSGDAIGPSVGTRIVAGVVARPPWWLRPSFHERVGASSLVVAVLLLAVVAVALAVCARDARQRDDRESFGAVLTAAVALAAGLLTAARAPVSAFGIASHQFRWLWPLSAFAWFAVAITVLRRLAVRPARIPAAVGALTLVTVVVAVLNLPSSNQGTSTVAAAVPVAHDLGDQLDDLDVDGTVVVTGSANVADPYGSTVLAVLARQRIPFMVGPGLVPPRQFNEARNFDGGDNHPVLYVEVGESARQGPAGTRPVALHDGLDRQERLELSRLGQRIGEFIRGGGLVLNEQGEAALDDGGLPLLRELLSEPGGAAAPFLKSREITYLVTNDLLVLDDPWARRLERYVELQRRSDEETVGVYLGRGSAGLEPDR